MSNAEKRSLDEPLDQKEFNGFSASIALKDERFRLVAFRYLDHEDLYAVAEIKGVDYFVEEGGQLLAFDYEDKMKEIQAACISVDTECGLIKIYNHPKSYAPSYLKDLSPEALSVSNYHLEEEGAFSNLMGEFRGLEGGRLTKRRKLR